MPRSIIGKKTLEETMEFLDYMAETFRRWEEFQMEGENNVQPTPEVEDKVHKSKEDITMGLQLEILTKILEELEGKFARKSKLEQDTPRTCEYGMIDSPD